MSGSDSCTIQSLPPPPSLAEEHAQRWDYAIADRWQDTGTSELVLLRDRGI